jgi:hypothetical protein
MDAVNAHSDDEGRISEESLNKIIPPDCVALVGIESILIKCAVDLDISWYRVNSNGIVSISNIAKQMNLLSGYKLALLEKVVSEVKVKVRQ